MTTPARSPSRRSSTRTWTIAFALAASAAAAGWVWLRARPAPSARPAAAAAPANDPVDDGLRYQIPVTGTQPSRGPQEAPVVMVLWGDLGPAERALEPVLEVLQQRHANELRLVYRHHLAADRAARVSLHELARIAHERGGKFWELRAWLLDEAIERPEEADLQRFAAAVGLDWEATRTALADHSYQRHIAADGIFGAQFGVSSAPGIFVNGRRFVGEPTLVRLERLIAQELGTAKTLLARGVAPAALYTELTKDALWRAGQVASFDPQARR